MDVASQLVAIPGFEEDFKNMITTIKYDIPKTALSTRIKSQGILLNIEKRQSKLRQKMIKRLEEGKRKLLNKYTTQKRKSAQKIKELESTIADLEGIYMYTSDALNTKDGDIQRQQMFNEIRKKNISSLEKERDELSEKLDEEMKDRQREFDMLMDQIENLESSGLKSDARKLQIDNLKEKLKEKREEMNTLKDQMKAKEEALVNALKKVNVFEKVARESRRGYEDAKRRVATLRDSLFRERKTRDEKITELEGTIADLKGENLSQRLSATRLRKEGQFKSKKITQLKQEASQLSEKLDAEIRDRQREFDMLMDQIEKLELGGLKSDARKLQIDNLKDKLKEKREEIMDFESLKKELKEAKEDYIDLEEQCKQTVEKYENRRVIEGKEMKSLRRQLADEKNKHRELKRLHETLKESHSELEQRYKELVDSCEEGKVVEELHGRIEKLQNEHATRLEEIRDGKLDTDERQLLQLQTQYNAVKTRVDAQERVLELVEYRKIQEIGDKMKKAKTMKEIEPLEKELKAALGRVQQIVEEKEQLMKDAKKRILRDAMRIRNNSIRSGTWKTVIKALFFVLILSMNLIMTQNLAAGRRQELEDYVSGTSNNANLFRMMLNGKNISPDNAIDTMLKNDGTPQQLVNDMLNGKYNTKKDDEKISDDEARPVVKDTEFNIVDKAINNLNPVRFENPVVTWLGEHQGYSRDDFKGMVLKLLKERRVDLQNPDDPEVRRKIREAINDVLKTDPDPLPKIDEVDAVPKKIRY